MKVKTKKEFSHVEIFGTEVLLNRMSSPAQNTEVYVCDESLQISGELFIYGNKVSYCEITENGILVCVCYKGGSDDQILYRIEPNDPPRVVKWELI